MSHEIKFVAPQDYFQLLFFVLMQEQELYEKVYILNCEGNTREIEALAERLHLNFIDFLKLTVSGMQQGGAS